MQKEIKHWTRPPAARHLPDNRGWWVQWRDMLGDIVVVRGPFKTREEAERAKLSKRQSWSNVAPVMSNLITDRELLQDCLKAFKAIPVAAASRKVLKGRKDEAWTGNCSHVLARYMAETIEAHLAESR